MGYLDDSYSKALLHMDGADASTTFTDESGKAWTAYGHAQIDTGRSVFGGASGLFDGNGDDYVKTNNHEDFNFGAGDFTIDLRVRHSAFVAFNSLITYATLSTRGWSFRTVSDISFGLYWTTDGGTDKEIGVNYAFSANTWYHLAISRTGGKIYFFVNGTLLNAGGTAFADHIYDAGTPTVLGRFGNYSAANHSFAGWIDELRVSKGIARWTANFTPPTAPYGHVPKVMMI